MKPEELYEAFRLALLHILRGPPKLEQKRIAEAVSLAPSTFNQILKGTRKGPEELRRLIASHLGWEYEAMLRFGYSLLHPKISIENFNMSPACPLFAGQRLPPKEVCDLMQKTLDVLTSGYSSTIEALEKNINEFHDTIRLRRLAGEQPDKPHPLGEPEARASAGQAEPEKKAM